MTHNNKYKLYLEDLGILIKEYALRVKETSSNASIKNGFEEGEMFACYRIISIMQQQAKAFDIQLSEINLDDINPDKHLT
jgi:hypothetical protein